MRPDDSISAPGASASEVTWLAALADTAALLDAVPWGGLDLSVLVSVQRRVVPTSNPYRGGLRDRPAVITLNGQVHRELGGVTEAGTLADRALRKLESAIESGAAKTDAVGTACEIAFSLMEAHPFIDGNGRVARAVANWILQRAGYSLRCDPQTYCRRRQSEYYEALAERQASRDRGLDQDRWRVFFQGLVQECYEPLVCVTNVAVRLCP